MDAILAFHSIDDGGSVLSYRRDELAQLLDGLLEEGVAFARLDEIVRRPTDERPRVALTFDDGLRSVRTDALPLLRERKLPFTVYVVSGHVGRNNRWPSQPRGIPKFDLMDWDELRELRDAGADIGCHTASHVHLRGLIAEEWNAELVASRQKIEEELQKPARHFAFPYGSYDVGGIMRVAALYDTAVTTELGFVKRPVEKHRLPRLDTFYLRAPRRNLPLFGARSRLRLRLRALLRRVKSRSYGS